MAWNENIKIQREKNSLTQQQLADRLYVSRQTVCRWESGSRCPDLAMTKRIAQVFGITMDELLSEADASCGSGNYGFPYPTKILALEKRHAQGKRIQELIQIGAGICVGVDILIMGAYDMDLGPGDMRQGDTVRRVSHGFQMDAESSIAVESEKPAFYGPAF